MSSKEKPFVSAVVCVSEDSRIVGDFLKRIYGFLNETFEYFEIIVVDDCSEDDTFDVAAATAEDLDSCVSVLQLSRKHGVEMAILAGLDKSVGDFVYEFESPAIDYDIELLREMFEASKSGSDVVAACPKRRRFSLSSMFYWTFNRASRLDYQLTTERISLTSRRALNSLLDINERIRYRKALVSLAGYPKRSITYSPINRSFVDKRSFGDKIETALDVFVSYSTLGSKLPLYASVGMMFMTLGCIVYVIMSVMFKQDISSGWPSLFGLMTLSYSALFFMVGLLSHCVSKVGREVINTPAYTIQRSFSRTKN